YSAVTAACLLINKNKFINFDSKFRIAFNDVDFNLKLLNKKFFNLFTPFSLLKHYESISVGLPESGNRDLKQFEKEILTMYKKWRKIINNDPLYNKNLNNINESYNLKI
ncbi:MAG: glycosyltransferase family 2 protein, partial [Candidatus Methanomethylicia archaeon]